MIKRFNYYATREWLQIGWCLFSAIFLAIGKNWIAAGWAIVAAVITFNFRLMRLKYELSDKQFKEYIEEHQNE